jgi:hypothetical protein
MTSISSIGCSHEKNINFFQIVKRKNKKKEEHRGKVREEGKLNFLIVWYNILLKEYEKGIEMNWNRMTLKSQEAFQHAQSKAQDLDHQELKSDHLLWAFLGQEESVVNAVLAKIGADPAKIRTEAEKNLEALPKVKGAGEIYISSELRQIVKMAEKEAEKLKDEYISA